jgi:hypothetical protein
MGLERRVLPLVTIFASLFIVASCTNNLPVSNPTPNYNPSEAIKERLQEAANVFTRDFPIPTYLPKNYAISDVQVNQPESGPEVDLTFTCPNEPDIIMSINWFSGTFRLLPASENYKAIDISGGPGTYSQWAMLNFLSDKNDLWWDWTPVTFSADEPQNPSAYYEMVLSASKKVPTDELVNIAKFVRLPQLSSY